MKVKTIVACALTATALPFAALAQNAQPSGPQGTGWYGAPNAAQPVPQPVPGTYGYVAPGSDAYVVERDMRREEMRRDDMRRDTREVPRRTYSGFSADTNPPVPAP